MLTLYVATLTTAHFTFTAVGETPDEAKRLMRGAWDRHAKQTGASHTWRHVAPAVDVTALTSGAVLRDGESFPLADNAAIGS